MTAPVLSIHAVGPDGSISLAAANVPYSSILWNRSRSAPGTFEADLLCDLPVPWPGRYLVTLTGRDECGVVEKVEAADDGATPPKVSGRFAESLWDRYRLGHAGGTARGADWRQAVTAALSAWHMADLPPLSMGAGTEAATGSSASVSGEAGDSAADLIYQVCNDNSAHPLVSYDRASDRLRLAVSIVDERDLTREQRALPWKVFSLDVGSALSAEYSGDYSCACSVVEAFAAGTGEGAGDVVQTVSVASFDAATQWQQRAYEDVSSLIDEDTEPTPALVADAGRLRTQDHEAALEVDCSVISAGYRTDWDLGDLCEVEVASIGLVAQERIEEVRETVDANGESIEVALGMKYLSRISRYMVQSNGR